MHIRIYTIAGRYWNGLRLSDGRLILLNSIGRVGDRVRMCTGKSVELTA